MREEDKEEERTEREKEREKEKRGREKRDRDKRDLGGGGRERKCTMLHVSIGTLLPHM